MNSALLRSASDYSGRGWSVIPMRGKHPAVRWKQYQQKPATTRHFRRWFGDDSDMTGLAIIFGRVSSNLGERDFDDLATYERWSSEQPALAKTLPTVVTHRGRRVIFTVDPNDLLDVRQRLGKTGRNGSIKLENGELRADVGCYSVFPRSQHPSGTIYEWAATLPAVIPPAPLSAFVTTTIDVSPYCDTCNVSGCVALCDVVEDEEEKNGLKNRIRLAIDATLPTGPGQRNRKVFEFVQHLKGFPEFRRADAAALEPIVRRWHTAAWPFTSKTKTLCRTLADFVVAWKRAPNSPWAQRPLAQSSSGR